MTWLDCRTHRTTLVTLAATLGRPPASLAAAIETESGCTGEGDPLRCLPRAVLRRLGVDPPEAAARAEGAVYFHGTRLADTNAVLCHGLLPLSGIVDAIWEMLGALAAPETDTEAWIEFRTWVEAGGGGDDGRLYRMKIEEPIHDGPFTVLVRDLLLHPAELGWHNYLDCPEIVQDICRCHEAHLGPGLDLEGRFRSATDPCIVTVKRARIGEEEIETAIWFIRSGLLDLRPGLGCAGGSGRSPGAIPAADIVSVEVVGTTGDRRAYGSLTDPR
jgi:hypothetical protein